MKKVKLLAICAAALVVGSMLAGCKSMQLDYLEEDSVRGPEQVRQGLDINPRDITVWGIYKDGSRKVVNLSRNNITFNGHTPGRQEVKVRVGVLTNQEVSFWTEVVALRSISIASPAANTVFKQGQEPDRAWPGLVIQGEWDKMGAAPIDISNCELTGYNRDQVGAQTITVAFEGTQTTFRVEVRRMTLQIAQQPTKLEYLQGESLDWTGLRVNATWEGLPSEELQISSADLTGYNPNTIGNQTITITRSSATATFRVNVLGLTGISIDVFPTKDVYKKGEEIDLTGIEVMGNYTGSSTTQSRQAIVPIDRLVPTNYNPELIGRQVVRLQVRGAANGVFANFQVTVVQP